MQAVPMPGPESAMTFRNIIELIRLLEPLLIAVVGAYVSIKLRGIHTLVNSTATEQRMTISKLEGENKSKEATITEMRASRVAVDALMSERAAVREAVQRHQAGEMMRSPVTAPVPVVTMPGQPLEVKPTRDDN